MSLGLRVRQCPRDGRPRALKSCLVEEIFLRAETAIYELFTFHEPHLCYTVVVITLPQQQGYVKVSRDPITSFTLEPLSLPFALLHASCAG
jgi:hypothetical protein